MGAVNYSVPSVGEVTCRKCKFHNMVAGNLALKGKYLRNVQKWVLPSGIQVHFSVKAGADVRLLWDCVYQHMKIGNQEMLIYRGSLQL